MKSGHSQKMRKTILRKEISLFFWITKKIYTQGHNYQGGGEWSLPYPFLRTEKKITDFGKKCPDYVHL